MLPRGRIQLLSAAVTPIKGQIRGRHVDLDSRVVPQGVINIFFGKDASKELLFEDAVDEQEMSAVDGEVLAVGFGVGVSGGLVHTQQIAGVILCDEARWTVD